MKFRIIWLNVAVKFRPKKNENVSGKEERKNLYLGGTLAESEGTTEQRDIGRAGEASDDIHGLGPH